MKQKQKLERFFCQYENVINDNITKEFFKSKSPHVILSNKTFNSIKLNVIMLTKPMIDDVSRNRKIFYDIKHMGGNIQKTKKGKYYNLNPSSTSRNLIFIIIAFHAYFCPLLETNLCLFLFIKALQYDFPTVPVASLLQNFFFHSIRSC